MLSQYINCPEVSRQAVPIDVGEPDVSSDLMQVCDSSKIMLSHSVLY